MEPRRLNRYQTLFSAACPVNGQLINYDLTIVTGDVIMVEELQQHLYGIGRGLHEDIADSLWLKFGGHQTLAARHHGVDIKTERSPQSGNHWLDQSLRGMAGTPGY